MRSFQRRENGIALVAVLWAVAILSLIAAAIVTTASLSYRIGRNTWSRAQLEAAADAATARAILGVLDARAEARWRVDGTPQAFEFNAYRFEIRVEDDAGKIDLNEADGAVIQRLFAAAGVTEAEAAELKDAILDWRSRPPMGGPLSGTAALNSGAGASNIAPRKGPFQSLDELSLVPGLTAPLFEAVKNAVTIYSGRATIDTASAPKLALMAYEAIDAARADARLAERAIRSGPAGVISDGRLNLDLPYAGRVLTIIATTHPGENRSFERRTTILLTGDIARPYIILDHQ